MEQGLREILISGIANRRTIIHFPNGEYPDITEGIYSGSLKVEEILNSEETLNFGECNASKFEATIAGIDDISNLIIYVYQDITYDLNKVNVLIDRDERYIITREGLKIAVGRHRNYTVPLFYGRVDSAKLQTDRIHRDITAYDELYYKGDINCAEWYKTLYEDKEYVTLRAFRDSLFEFVGIPQNNVGLINDSIHIEETIEVDALKFGDLVKAICQLNGVFGHIDREGIFQYIDLTNVTNSYDISDNYRSNDSTYEAYTVKKIDKLQIRSDEEDIGAIVGTGDNPYILQGNFLIYGKSAAELNTIATTIFNKIKNIEYRPIEAQTIYSEPYIAVGDKLTVITKRDNETINTFVLNAVLSGIQLLKQELIAEGDEYRDEVVDDVNAEIKQLQGKTLKIIKNVDEFSVEVEDLTKGYTSLKQTAEELSVQIYGKDGDSTTLRATVEGLYTDINGKDGKFAKYSATLTELSAQIYGEDGNSTTLKATVEGIEGKVESVETGLSQTVRIAANGVTITNASGETLTIDGGQIDAKNLNLSGRITFNDLNNGTQNKINNAYDKADAASNTVSGWVYNDTTYIDGTMIKTGTVMASHLIGGKISLYDSGENEAGYITLNSATTADYALDIHSNGALRLIAEDGAVYISDDTDTYIQISGYTVSVGAGDLCPGDDDELNCGLPGLRWSDIYATNATIQTSDITKKENIEYGLGLYDKLFDSLKPVSFTFKKNTSGRRHIGLIAQDVEKAMSENNISSADFAVFIKSPKKDDNNNEIEGEYDYALRYGELIALCIEQIQKLKEKVYSK